MKPIISAIALAGTLAVGYITGKATNSIAQSALPVTDTTYTYTVGFRMIAPPGTMPTVNDGVANDSADMTVTVQASTFQIACYKLVNFVNPNTQTKPYQTAARFTNLTIK